jgi:hypothetical protein
MNWTFREITVDSSDEYENANASTRVKCEFDSNVIDESDSQNEKQFFPNISMFLPISIADNAEKFPKYHNTLPWFQSV